MKKVLILLLMFIMAFGLPGCGEDGEAANASVPVPSLAELAGRYEDGAITFEKVHVSEEMLAAAQKKADDAAANADEDDPFDQIEVAGAGCDIAMLQTLMSYEGQTLPNPFIISVLSETEGTLQFEGEDSEDSEIGMDDTEVIAFSYSSDSGALTFTEEMEGVRVANSLYAAYMEENKVGISGTLRLTTTEKSESDFYIDLTVTGTKLLGGQ